jgi:MoaA/NifB/PqqE/SkfB family radical SAM enzyme
MKTKTSVTQKTFVILKKISRLVTEFIPQNTRLYRFLHFAGLKLTIKARLTQRKVLNFSISIAEHCNLNCISCEKFCPIAEPKFIDINVFEKDCARMAQLAGTNIELINLYGGEPLLHPQIIECIKILRRYFKDAPLMILSNGLLLPMQPKEFWLACKENAVSLYLTHYPISLDFDNIKNIAANYKVNVDYYDNFEPVKVMWKVPLNKTLFGGGGGGV